jgi:hypothetical protein
MDTHECKEERRRGDGWRFTMGWDEGYGKRERERERERERGWRGVVGDMEWVTKNLTRN